MRLKIYHIDAFTHEVFKGNYAAVIVLKTWLTDELMQAIASENNLSETAFVVLENDNRYRIRWFSPVCEIDFCGHATLASAFVLFKQHPQLLELNFYAQAIGNFTVTKQEDNMISMTFPHTMPEKVTDIPTALLSGLSITPQEVLRNNQAYFALYENEQDIFAITSEPNVLKQLAPFDVVVSSKADKNSSYDIISRYFWPANGGEEDPVTGSIHTGLAPLWAQRLHKNVLTAYQASSRGGMLYCKVTPNHVEISGQAVQYLEGIINLNENINE